MNNAFWIITFFIPVSSKYSEDPEEHKRLEHKIIHYLKNEPEKFQEEYEKDATESFNNFYGVLSISSEWNNILMWSHYADKHRGLAVGFKEKQLFASGLFTGEMVKYPNNRDYPTISPTEGNGFERHLKTIYHKSIDWKYENEYRLAKIFRPPHIPNEEERKINFDPSLIEEVIIGINICPDHKNEILKICKKHDIRVFQAQRVKSKFLIDRKQIFYF